jgi:hypothetical protein
MNHIDNKVVDEIALSLSSVILKLKFNCFLTHVKQIFEKQKKNTIKLTKISVSCISLSSDLIVHFYIDSSLFLTTVKENCLARSPKIVAREKSGLNGKEKYNGFVGKFSRCLRSRVKASVETVSCWRLKTNGR